MEEKVASGLGQQQARRKRINRMKISMVAGLIIWILVLTVLIVALLVKVILLEQKLNDTLISKEEVTQEHDEKNAESPKDNTSDTILKDDAVAQNQPEGGMAEDVNDEPESIQDEEVLDKEVPEDDGPSENTAKILDILKERNIKATFFVIGQEDDESKELYRRIVAEGHTLGMHSFSHKYDAIYKSRESFAEDMLHLQSYLKEVTGVAPTLIRFPGGSSNGVSNVDIKELIRYVREQGWTYFDWNVASGDATSQVYTPDELVANVMNDVVKYDTSVVLMHDSSAKGSTVDALVPMIDQLQAIGAELLPIDENTKPIQHIKAEDVE